MTASQMLELRRKKTEIGTAIHLGSDQRRKVALKVEMRTVTSMLLSGAANVLGQNGVVRSHTRSIAGLLNSLAS